MLPARICARGVQARSRLRGEARRQSVQVRHGRFDRCPTRRSPPRRRTTSSAKFPPLGAICGTDPFDEVVAGRAANPQGKDIKQYAWQTSAASASRGCGRATNTREALWDAMARKEVYATTGTRLLVRVFGGFDFTADDLFRSDFAERGYQGGVPMGGDLKSAPAGKVPTLLIRAPCATPDGANLDRIQVIKGWLDAAGKTQEKVYDVAWSDPEQRKPGADGKLPAVGNTVNVQQASYTNAIGAPTLEAYWRDPAFNPAERAFYYVTRDRNSNAALDDVRRQVLRIEDSRTERRPRSRNAPTPLRSGTRRETLAVLRRSARCRGISCSSGRAGLPGNYHDPRTIAFGALNLCTRRRSTCAQRTRMARMPACCQRVIHKRR